MSKREPKGGEGGTVSFLNTPLQRWLGGLVSSRDLEIRDPLLSWTGTVQSATRRLWHFSDSLRWVWRRGNEYQAFEEFEVSGPDGSAVYELNGYVTTRLTEGISPAEALYQATEQFGSTDPGLAGKLTAGERGGFALFGKIKI